MTEYPDRLNGRVREPILAAESLTLLRGRRPIYKNLTVSFGTGVTALLGPDGAGKTTLIEGSGRAKTA